MAEDQRPPVLSMFESAMQSPSRDPLSFAEVIMRRAPDLSITADLDFTDRKVFDMTPAAKEALVETARLTSAVPAEEKTKQVAEETKREIRREEEQTKRKKEDTKQVVLAGVRHLAVGGIVYLFARIAASNPTTELCVAMGTLATAVCGADVWKTYIDKKSEKDKPPPSSK